MSLLIVLTSFGKYLDKYQSWNIYLVFHMKEYRRINMTKGYLKYLLECFHAYF